MANIAGLLMLWAVAICMSFASPEKQLPFYVALDELLRHRKDNA